jgi:hypothetical protein
MRLLTYGAICLVLLLGAGPAVAQDGRGGVKYSAWSAKKGKSCTVAINIVDPGNFKHYGFGFTGNALAVI